MMILSPDFLNNLPPWVGPPGDTWWDFLSYECDDTVTVNGGDTVIWRTTLSYDLTKYWTEIETIEAGCQLAVPPSLIQYSYGTDDTYEVGSLAPCAINGIGFDSEAPVPETKTMTVAGCDASGIAAVWLKVFQARYDASGYYVTREINPRTGEIRIEDEGSFRSVFYSEELDRECWYFIPEY